MRRVVSLYLPSWPTDRLRRRLGAGAPPPERPLVTAGRDGSRRIVMAADAAALALGLRPGLALTQAQAYVPGLLAVETEPAADALALERLALWALRRYSPVVAIDGADGLLLDATGVAHLFGGEAALLADLAARLARAGLRACAAVADTAGAAHALARFAADPVRIAPPGATAQVLAALPLAALRLPPELMDQLHRLGFTTMAELDGTPRAPLAQRFGTVIGLRLDQAFGRIAEPLVPVCLPELTSVRRSFAEPIGAPETLARCTGQLAQALCLRLERKGLGARRLDLLFHCIDSAVQAVRVGTARAVRDAAWLSRLLTDRLEEVDPGFGVEAMTLTAIIAEPLGYHQASVLADGEAMQADLAALVDRLANRLGAGQVYRLAPVPSDLPERSVRVVAALDPPLAMSWPGHWPRPSRLLSPPEPVQALALLPDWPPVQFTWRGIRRQVSRADGPERVFGEWWRSDAELAAVRDYFLVEDEAGERFWLFRSGDGQDPATGSLGWFLHGLFA